MLLVDQTNVTFGLNKHKLILTSVFIATVM